MNVIKSMTMQRHPRKAKQTIKYTFNGNNNDSDESDEDYNSDDISDSDTDDSESDTDNNKLSQIPPKQSNSGKKTTNNQSKSSISNKKHFNKSERKKTLQTNKRKMTDGKKKTNNQSKRLIFNKNNFDKSKDNTKSKEKKTHRTEIGKVTDVKTTKLEKVLLLMNEFKNKHLTKSDGNKHIQQLLETQTKVSALVWSEMSDIKLAEAILSSKNSSFVDPRVDWKSQCVFIGLANTDLPSEEILSFCYPKENDKCNFKLCFSLRELNEFLNLEPHKNGKQVPNIFKQEIVQKVPELANSITDFLSEEFVQLVRFQQQIVESKDLSFEFTETQSALTVNIASILLDFFRNSPAALTIGGVVGWIKEKTPNWTKTILNNATYGIKWLFHNPFWANVILLISKSLRIFACAYIAGISKDDFHYILSSMLDTIASNPIGSAFINITSTLLSCVTSIGLVGVITSPTTVVSCLVSSLSSTLTIAHSVVKYIAQVFLFVLRKGLEIIFPKSSAHVLLKTIEMTAECYTNINKCIFWALDSSEDGKQLQMNPTVRNEIFGNVTATLFFALLYTIPASAIDYIVDVIFRFLPHGNTVKNAAAYIQKSRNTENDGTQMTLGDIFMTAIKIGGRTSIIAVLSEFYTWFNDVAGCWVKKMRMQLVGANTTIDNACCFKGVVDQIKSILDTTVQNPAMSKNTANATFFKWISDRRVKKLVYPNPIFEHEVGKRTIKFYSYKWNIKEIKPKFRKYFDRRIHVGIMAQELKRDFPDAVAVDKNNIMYVRIDKLDCDLVSLLCLFNGIQPPKKCSHILKLSPHTTRFRAKKSAPPRL